MARSAVLFPPPQGEEPKVGVGLHQKRTYSFRSDFQVDVA